MNQKFALVSYYIRDGINKFNDEVESVLKKRKQKRNKAEQAEFTYDYSPYNFFEVRPFKIKNSLFNQEIMNHLEGKQRTKRLFEKETNLEENINMFRTLTSKFLGSCKYEYFSAEQATNLCNDITYKCRLSLFHQFLQDNEINQKIEQVSKKIEEIQIEMRPMKAKLYKEIDQILIVQRSQAQFNEHYSILISEYKSQFLPIAPKLEEDSQNTEIVGEIIRKNTYRWCKQLLGALNMDQMLTSTRPNLQWDSKFIKQEQKNISQQRVSGKMLFQIQEKIIDLKEKVRPITLLLEYNLRKGKMNHLAQFRQTSVNKNKKQKQKVTIIKQYSQNHQIIQPEKQIKAISNPQEKYENMALRINKLKNYQKCISYQNKMGHNRTQHRVNFQYNAQIKEKIPQIQSSKLDSRNPFTGNRLKAIKVQALHWNDKSKNSLRKPSPLRPDQMEKFSFKNQPAKLNFRKNQVKKLIKYPIKIKDLEIYSANYAILCYRYDEINLKQLPLKFIRDRLLFKENRVKIEYPTRFTKQVEQLVSKGMHILNCLGAEVTCQMQLGYTTWNEIDDAQVLAVSWLLSRPVSEVIERYQQFVGSSLTKK